MARSRAARTAFVVLAVALLLTSYAVLIVWTDPGDSVLRRFRSQAELEAFLESSQGRWGTILEGGGPFADVTTAAGGSALRDAETLHSGTNVQVQGVDEADILKTDGEYVYLARPASLSVIRATPPEEMEVVVELSAETLLGEAAESYGVLNGLFLQGRSLVVLGSGYERVTYATFETSLRYGAGGPNTTLAAYDVADPTSPAHRFTKTVSGTYQTARLVDGHLYLVTQSQAQDAEGSVVRPELCDDGGCQTSPPRDIFYDPELVGSSGYTNVLAVDLETGTSTLRSLLTGYTSVVYMSPQALYVANGVWSVGGVLGDGSSDWSTHLHKIVVSGTDVNPVASGEVPGHLVNQFALDEWDGHLRVATTTWGEGPANHVYVLDGDLTPVGALEGLAPGERIYSVRFLGERGYLVTFKQVDPFFALNLSNPAEPRVLGFLKLPGFSEYMHPVGEDLVLGVGKETVEAEDGDIAWFQGLKLSLFDVSDPAQPVEASKLILGHRGSTSPVLWDHRAFLFIKERGTVVLPADLAEVGASDPPFAFRGIVWKGAYLVNVTEDGELGTWGRVTHWESADGGTAYEVPSVLRTLYIGDTLYTVSSGEVRATSLTDLSPLGQLSYGAESGV